MRALSTSMVEQSISSGFAPPLRRLDQAALVQPDLAHMLAGGQHGDDESRRRAAASAALVADGAADGGERCNAAAFRS